MITYKMLDDSLYLACQLKMSYFGDYKKRVPIHLFKDLESTLEFRALLKLVHDKNLHKTVQELKECLVCLFAYRKIWADVVIKEIKLPEILEKA